MKWYQKEYSLYKGDEIIASGTIPQLHKATGKSIDFLRYMTYPIYKKRSRGSQNRLVMEQID